MLKISTKKPSQLLLPVVLLVGLVTATLLFYALLKSSQNANAYLDGFDPGNIMSDFVMSNKNTMSESDIQKFLKSKNACNKKVDSEIKYYQDKGYVYSISGDRVLCMADDKFNGETAAHIIWQAAQDYDINPQVLLVLLEKEQSLVTDTWPNSRQYESATGFGCPDTAACDPSYSGLKKQVRSAASFFHEVLSGGWSNYPVGKNKIYYSPNKACGYSWVNIQNKATSALYRYTPYQPNDAALAAGYGTGDSCSSYGNRNFYNLFTDWFGNAKTIIQSNADIPNGTYRLHAGDKYLDISGGSTANGANVQLWDYNVGDTVQDWKITKLSNGLYTLYNARSGKYLDVSGASTASGANVQIWQGTGACAQQWAITVNSNGYRLVSACSGKSLDIADGKITNGSNVQIWDSNDSAAQRWYIDGIDADIPNGTYRLHAGDKYLDISGGSTANGANVQLWDYNVGDTVQDWKITKLSNGLYTLYNARSGKYLDVSGASTASGANVQIWQGTGACAQQWAIVTSGRGYRILSSCSNKSLDIADGKIANGTNVRIWDNNGSTSQVWTIDGVDANVEDGLYTLSINNQFLDVSGNSISDGANVQLWGKTGAGGQKWQIKNLGNNLYTITNPQSNKYLDVAGASTKSGANVQIWQGTGACAQQWYIQSNKDGYRVVSRCSNKSLDVKDGKITNGSNVQIWDSNNTNAQRWKLTLAN